MRHPWKTFLIVFMAFWLPLQGYGAVAMPFCERGAGPSFAGASDHHADHSLASKQVGALHDHHASDGGKLPDTSKGQHKSLSCNGCSPCHLACAPAIAVAVPSVALPGATVHMHPSDVAMTSVSLERLQRPPRPALS